MSEDWAIRIGTVFMVFMIVIITVSLFRDNDVRDQRVSKCESKGGVLLDRTYTMGKTTGHNYTCIQPSVLIDMGE